MEEIRMAKTARECKKLARGDNDKRPRREDWAEVKDSVMYTALKAKFTQHENLKLLLLHTHPKTLIEHTNLDSYWADGGDGTGKNMLGKQLMQLREELMENLTEEETNKLKAFNETMRKKADSDNTIYFYGKTMGHYEFSNFYPAKIELDGKTFPTSEHYFQAMKFHEDEELVDKVRKCKGPGKAAAMGRDRKNPLRKDWEEVKDNVMYTALRAKFTQHEKLKKVLLDTGDKHIVEHTKNDHYWGDGLKNGKNMLGILLMKLRDEIRQIENEG